jgi:MATE family multidrug resistance protein
VSTVPNAYLEEPRLTGLKEVVKLAGPIIVGTMSFAAMQFVDQAMVAQLGDAALAAVGSAGIWAFTISTFQLGIVGTVSTFASQSLGRGAHEDCARYTWQGVYIALIAGLLAAVFWPLAPWMFGLMGHEPRVTELEISYFQVRLFGYGFIGLQGALISFFQAVNRPYPAMGTVLISNGLNILLNYCLIFGHFGMPRLEVAGAAVATVLSLGFNVLLLIALFLSPSCNRRFKTRRNWRPSLERMRELARIGWPAGMSVFMDVANWSIFTSILIGYFGTIQLAGHVATMELLHLSFMPALGMQHAVTVIVGQWIGRGDIRRAKARTYTAMKLCAVFMTSMGILLALYAKPIVGGLFHQGPEVVAVAQSLLIVGAIFQAFDAVNVVAMGALRGAGDTRFMAAMLVMFGYGLFLPLAWFLSVVMGLQALGAWIGATIYITLLSVVLFRRFHNEGWRHIRIFDSDMPEETATPR